MSTAKFGAPPYAAGTVASKEIVFIRHAQSMGNVEGLWHGRTDGPLSDAGEESLEHLGTRLSTWNFDIVVSSPLTRARRTAEAVSPDFVIDEDFIEMDVGRWEGRTFAEVEENSADELHDAFGDWSVPMGVTGESLDDLAKRAYTAIDRILDKLADGQRAVVVTHGGLLQTVLHRHLAGPGRPVHALTNNTAITRIVWQNDRFRLASFNDTGHLGPRSDAVAHHLSQGRPVLSLVRHGRTRANVEQRWQGHGDWDLDEVGIRQAEALGEWYGEHRTVYSSPLKRAMATASQVAIDHVETVDGLKEMDMGDWEGLTTAEIAERFPEDMERIYRDGMDLKRGGTGESWAELAVRVTSAITGIEPAEQEPTVVVAHGGAIRSYLGSLTASTDTHSESLFTPSNTSVSHVAMTEDGPLILDYAVAPHLEQLGDQD